LDSAAAAGVWALVLDPLAAALCFALAIDAGAACSTPEVLVPLSTGRVERGATLAWLGVLLAGWV
jgi:hypothetical protein